MRKATRVILTWYQKLRFLIPTLSFLLLATGQPLFLKLPPFFFSFLLLLATRFTESRIRRKRVKKKENKNSKHDDVFRHLAVFFFPSNPPKPPA